MNFVLDHQLALLFACFVLGCVGTSVIYCAPAGSRAWQLADLLWVVLGGLGAVTAVLAGIYTSDSSRLDRQIGIAYALTDAFDRDAARFRLRYCETGDGGDVRALCNKVEFLSASTAGNADLPLFLAITESTGQLRRLPLFSKPEAADPMTAGSFEDAAFLAFVALDDTTRPALVRLREPQPAIAADFQILASTYDGLIEQVRSLMAEWEFLRASAAILVLQTLALCLVAFAAPFRLGKSMAELR